MKKIQNIHDELSTIDHKIERAKSSFNLIDENTFLFIREYGVLQFGYKMHIKKLEQKKLRLNEMID